MLSQQTIEKYRKMAPGERLTLTFKAIEVHERALFSGTPEVVRRRFAQMRRRKNESNLELMKKLAEAALRNARD